MGTRLNHLTEAVLTCTHDLCFKQSENNHFYSREILQYVARTCLRNAYFISFFLSFFVSHMLKTDPKYILKYRFGTVPD